MQPTPFYNGMNKRSLVTQVSFASCLALRSGTVKSAFYYFSVYFAIFRYIFLLVNLKDHANTDLFKIVIS